TRSATRPSASWGLPAAWSPLASPRRCSPSECRPLHETGVRSSALGRDSMTRTLHKLPLALALALASACSVNESGKIKCVDDASCPGDYPLCSAGFCVEGTPTTANTVSVLGVSGKAS